MPSLSDAIERASGINFTKPQDADQLPERPIGEFIFTGTGLEYLKKRLNENNTFFAEGRKEVFYTTDVGGAYSAAKSRTHKFNDVPVVVVVNARNDKLNLRASRELYGNLISDPLPKEAIVAVYGISEITDSELVDVANQYNVLTTKGKRFEI